MKQQITPGMAALAIAVVLLAIILFAWRAFAPGSAAPNGAARLRQGGQPPVTRGPDGRLQFSPEARAQRGPSARLPASNAGAPSPR